MLFLYPAPKIYVFNKKNRALPIDARSIISDLNKLVKNKANRSMAPTLDTLPIQQLENVKFKK